MSLNKKILLTGGRAPVALDLARLLTKEGYQVFVAETNGIHLCQFSKFVTKCYKIPPPKQGFIHSLIEIIKKEKIDYLIPTFEEVFIIAAHYDELSQYCKLFCEPLQKLIPLHDKMEFMNFLRQNGFSTPKTILIQSIEDAYRALDAFPKVVFKRTYSRFSRHIIICKRGDREAIKAINPSETNSWIAQEFIEGRALCFYGVVYQGKLLAHVTYPVEYQLGKIGPALAYKNIDYPQGVKWVEKLVSLINYTGQISFDWIETDNKEIIPIECNPRATSGLQLFSEQDKIPKAFIEHQFIGSPKKMQFVQLTAFVLLLYPKETFSFCWGRDSIFRKDDFKPLVASPFILLYFLLKAWKKKLSLPEAMTSDLEWDGDPSDLD